VFGVVFPNRGELGLIIRKRVGFGFGLCFQGLTNLPDPDSVHELF